MTSMAKGTAPALSLTTVEGLVRPHLNFDEEQGSYRSIRSLGSIVGTHGTSIDSIVRLARDGSFSGGVIPDLDDPSRREFFATPNRRYAHWQKTDVSREIGSVIMARDFDAVKLAIEYSEPGGAFDQDTISGTHEHLPYGVVIAFNDHVLDSKPSISEDLKTGEYELVLPASPSLETIEGIYPVTSLVGAALNRVLSELH